MWVAYPLAALAYRALGRKELAEERRAEAVEWFGTLGAVTLLQKFRGGVVWLVGRR